MKTQCIISASLQVFCRRYLTASSALERKSLAEEAGFWEAIPPSPPRAPTLCSGYVRAHACAHDVLSSGP